MKKEQNWYSNYNFIALGIVFVALAIIIILQNIEVSELHRYAFTMILVLGFVISFAWFVSRKKKKINNDPLYSLAFMMYILIILTVALPVVSGL